MAKYGFGYNPRTGKGRQRDNRTVFGFCDLCETPLRMGDVIYTIEDERYCKEHGQDIVDAKPHILTNASYVLLKGR